MSCIVLPKRSRRREFPPPGAPHLRADTGSAHCRHTIGLLLAVAAALIAGTVMASGPGYFQSTVNPPGYPDLYATAMTIGPDGNVWIAEGFKGRVGTLSVTIDPVTTLTKATYTALAAKPSLGSASITSGSDGNLWFTENNGKIARMTTAGAITEFSVLTPQPDLGAISSGPDGALWFIDSGTFSGTTNLGRISANGTVKEYAIAGRGTYIKDLTAGADGTLWFVDGNAFKLYKASTAGAVLATYAIPSHGAQSMNSAHILLGPDGNVWFPGVNTLDRATTAGVITEYAIPTSGAYPAGIAVGTDGNLWFSEHGKGEIGYLVLSSATDSGQATIVESDLLIPVTQADQLFVIPPSGSAGPVPLAAGDVPRSLGATCAPFAFLVNDTGSEPGQNLNAVIVQQNPSTCADVNLYMSQSVLRQSWGGPNGTVVDVTIGIFNSGPNDAVSPRVSVETSTDRGTMYLQPVSIGETLTIDGLDAGKVFPTISPSHGIFARFQAVLSASNATLSVTAVALSDTPDPNPRNNSKSIALDLVTDGVLVLGPNTSGSVNPIRRGGH